MSPVPWLGASVIRAFPPVPGKPGVSRGQKTPAGKEDASAPGAPALEGPEPGSGLGQLGEPALSAPRPARSSSAARTPLGRAPGARRALRQAAGAQVGRPRRGVCGKCGRDDWPAAETARRAPSWPYLRAPGPVRPGQLRRRPRQEVLRRPRAPAPADFLRPRPAPAAAPRRGRGAGEAPAGCLKGQSADRARARTRRQVGAGEESPRGSGGRSRHGELLRQPSGALSVRDCARHRRGCNQRPDSETTRVVRHQPLNSSRPRLQTHQP